MIRLSLEPGQISYYGYKVDDSKYPMPEISRLNGTNDAIQLDFVERETTPKEMMELAIHLHLVGLSLSDTVSGIDNLGVYRTRSTVHN